MVCVPVKELARSLQIGPTGAGRLSSSSRLVGQGTLKGRLTPGKDRPGLRSALALRSRSAEEQINELMRRPPAAIGPGGVGAAKPGGNVLQSRLQVLLQSPVAAGMRQGLKQPGAPTGGEGEAAGRRPFTWSSAAESRQYIRQKGNRIGSVAWFSINPRLTQALGSGG